MLTYKTCLSSACVKSPCTSYQRPEISLQTLISVFLYFPYLSLGEFGLSYLCLFVLCLSHRHSRFTSTYFLFLCFTTGSFCFEVSINFKRQLNFQDFLIFNLQFIHFFRKRSLTFIPLGQLRINRRMLLGSAF